MRPVGKSKTTRVLCRLLIAGQVFALLATAQDVQPALSLNIVILDGDAAVNNVKQRTAREAMVRVEDQNHKPVAGALVIFAAPENGPGGSFVDGLKNFQVTTGTDGTARARFHPNNETGQFAITVTAMAAGVTAQAVIHQSNAAGGGGGGGGSAGGGATETTGIGLHISTKTLLIITSVVVAGAVAGAVVATRGGHGTTVTPGTGTVGAP